METTLLLIIAFAISSFSKMIILPINIYLWWKFNYKRRVEMDYNEFHKQAFIPEFVMEGFFPYFPISLAWAFFATLFFISFNEYFDANETVKKISMGITFLPITMFGFLFSFDKLMETFRESKPEKYHEYIESEQDNIKGKVKNLTIHIENDPESRDSLYRILWRVKYNTSFLLNQITLKHDVDTELIEKQFKDLKLIESNPLKDKYLSKEIVRVNNQLSEINTTQLKISHEKTAINAKNETRIRSERSCPKCGELYNILDYSADANSWKCNFCKADLIKEIYHE